MRTGWCAVRFMCLALAGAGGVAGCHRQLPTERTAVKIIGQVTYRVTLDGTACTRGEPIGLSVSAESAHTGPPPVTRLEFLLTPAVGGDPAAQADLPAKWQPGGGQWSVTVSNAFPADGAGSGARLGQGVSEGTYRVQVRFWEEDREVGQVGPLEVFVGDTKKSF